MLNSAERYYYDSHYKMWFDINKRPGSYLCNYTPNECKIDPNIISKLRNARKTTDFVIVKTDTLWRGIPAKYIYVKKDHLKLITKDSVYFVFDGERTYINQSSVVNLSKLKRHFTNDLSYVTDLIDVMQADHRVPKMYMSEEDLKMDHLRRQNVYNSLTDEQKIIYELDGKGF